MIIIMGTILYHKWRNNSIGFTLRVLVSLCLMNSILFLNNTAVFAVASKNQAFEAENAIFVGEAKKEADKAASGGQIVALANPGDAISFSKMPKAEKLVIRYSTVNVGTISVAVNNQPAVKANVISSGSITGYFLNAILNISIPKGAKLKISFDAADVAVSIDKIIVGNGDMGLNPDIWNLPPLPIADGAYSQNWKEISRNYTVPAWWREAKFGAWSHWSPQSMPEQGDWYARGMYMEGSAQYRYHVENFEHPSVYGYKDICHNWVIDKWNPDELMDLYIEMGARYFMAMGVHHDNFDCYDSKYQPWNSVNVGPKQDIVATWEKVARKHGMRFGIGFHNTPGRTWGQFMTTWYNSDKAGAMAGVPYDALQTKKDGKGLWWEGLNPVDLYGPVHDKKNPLLSPYANQFMWRIDDAITKYRPDVIYFDEHAGDSQVDLGVKMGLGFLAPQLIANYYNKSLQWNDGKMDVVVNLKGVGGPYNSFQNNPELLPLVDRSLVKSTEFIIEPEIRAYSFQTETSIAEWHYKTGQKYMSAAKVIELLLQNVSRNGTMLLNLTQRGRGDLDPEVVQIAKNVGAWLKINGEAIYGSRPFEVYGGENLYYTRNNGHVYATVLNWNDSSLVLNALHSDGNALGKVSKVELLGSDVAIDFVQDEKGLTITPKKAVQPLPGITDNTLAISQRVLRITHDKGWVNDDDPGIVAPGWFRVCNLGTGDYNNDLTISETVGDVWTGTFSGTGVTVISPKEEGAGTIEIKIDGETKATANLSTVGKRKPQQVVAEIKQLKTGNHTIEIINRGAEKVAIDALIIKK